MEYKLYYTNRLGQVAYPNGKLFERDKNKKDYYEIYDSLDEAKSKGENFLKVHPLMLCTIYYDKNEVVLYPDENLYLKAKEQLTQNSRKQMQKKIIFFVGLIMFIMISFIYFVAKKY